MDMPDRKCGTCGKLESAHYTHGPNGALGLGHVFSVSPGDEWCDDCNDWVVNRCGSEKECEERAWDDDCDRAHDALYGDL
jgi:hypothetical protein